VVIKQTLKRNAVPAGLGRLVLAFTVQLVANGLAGAGGPGFPRDNAELSAINPTYITPDGLTFAIWGLIYLFEILSLIEMSCGRGGFNVHRRDAALSSLSLAFLLNAAWLLAFAQEAYLISLVIMICYLFALLATYLELDMVHDTDIFLPVSVSMNLAWVCVATCLNFLITSARMGWTFLFDVGLSAPGEQLLETAGTPLLSGAAIIVITLLALWLLGTRRDWPFAATVAWACLGLRRGQPEVIEVTQVATYAAIVCGVLVAYTVLMRCRCRRSPSPLLLPLSSTRELSTKEHQFKTVKLQTDMQDLQERMQQAKAVAVNTASDVNSDVNELKDQFNHAKLQVTKMDPTTNVSNSTRLKLYSLFKSATVGPVQGQRPSRLHAVDCAKYDAWAKNKNMDKQTAMRQYIDAVNSIKR